MKKLGPFLETLSREQRKAFAWVIADVIGTHREVKAKMVLKGLSLRDVAEASGLNYGVLSQILNGVLIDPLRMAEAVIAINLAKEAQGE